MSTIDFLKKLCPVGVMLHDRTPINQHIPLDERRQLFDETGTFNTPEEEDYAQHVRTCPVCKAVLK